MVGLLVGVLSSESAEDELYRPTLNVVTKTVLTEPQAVLPLARRDAREFEDAIPPPRVEGVYPKNLHGQVVELRKLLRVLLGESASLTSESRRRHDRVGHTRLAARGSLRSDPVKLLGKLVRVPDAAGLEVFAAQLDLALDDRIAELQIVFKLVDVHDGRYRHPVALENNVLLVAVYAADHLAELRTELCQW